MPASDMKLRNTTGRGETWAGIADALNLAAVRNGSAECLLHLYDLPAADPTSTKK